MLSARDFERTLKSAVDSSYVDVGAVLVQVDNHGVDHRVSHFSQKLNRFQQSFPLLRKNVRLF